MKFHKITRVLILVTYVFVIVGLMFPLVSRIPSKFATDSGFDSSFDSGGSWDSGSDWDSSSSSSHSSGSGRHSSGESVFGTFLLMFAWVYAWIAIPCFVILTYNFFKHFKVLSPKERLTLLICIIGSFIPFLHIYLANVGTETYEKYSKKEEKISNDKINEDIARYGFTQNILVQQAFSIYKKVQIAWMNGDVEPVRAVLSDEIYNMYKTQLMTLTAKSQKNMMEEIKFKSGTVTSLIEQNDDVAIGVDLKVTCKDYIINTNDNQVVRGDKNYTCNYEYNLTFTFNKNEVKVIINCPNCNAKLPLEGKSVRCEYCGSSIKRESTNLVMTKKEMIDQY